MKTAVYNLSGKEIGAVELNDAVFNVEVKPAVVHQVYVAQSSNARESIAHTKTRGDVRGGGKKPWAQKGTGRARHGSSRSPIWSGGGVTFGPTSERNWKMKINKNTRRLAVKMCLTDKAQNNAFYVVEDFNFVEPKTKLVAEFLKNLPSKNKNFVLLNDESNKNLVKISRNLKKLNTIRAKDVTVSDLLNKEAVIVSKLGLEQLEAVLVK
ncbi:MAG TPA: 50S ribosomal protein L4 [Candidatus Magasanikbacteria bacterium]|nr:50S ribosomal protein L4 [Candidatus Magasanikbacteria bacterium]